LFSPLICGSIDNTLYHDDGKLRLWHKGTGLLRNFKNETPSPSYYLASTYVYNFKADADPSNEEVTRIVQDHAEGYPQSGMLRIPTPCLVVLLRYFYYIPHGWNAQILFHGIEVNVDPNMLHPLDGMNLKRLIKPLKAPIGLGILMQIKVQKI